MPSVGLPGGNWIPDRLLAETVPRNERPKWDTLSHGAADGKFIPESSLTFPMRPERKTRPTFRRRAGKPGVLPHGQIHVQVAVVAVLAVCAGDQVSANLSAWLKSARVCLGDKVVKEVESKAPTVAGVQPGL